MGENCDAWKEDLKGRETRRPFKVAALGSTNAHGSYAIARAHITSSNALSDARSE